MKIINHTVVGASKNGEWWGLSLIHIYCFNKFYQLSRNVLYKVRVLAVAIYNTMSTSINIDKNVCFVHVKYIFGHNFTLTNEVEELSKVMAKHHLVLYCHSLSVYMCYKCTYNLRMSVQEFSQP